MSGIFISYRRDETSGHAGRLFDRLSQRFGGDFLFMDVTDIAPGEDFTRVIEESVGTADLLLAVIGPHWLSASDGATRRLDNPSDFVRREIAAAFHGNTPVIPILVRGARMRREDELPEEIRSLARRQAVELSDNRWESDLANFERALDERLHRPARKVEEKRAARFVATPWRVVAGLVLMVAVLVYFWNDLSGKSPDSIDEAVPTSDAVSQREAVPTIDAGSQREAVPTGDVGAEREVVPDEAQGPGSTDEKTAPPKAAFSIKISDKIDDGVPGPGSGTIETPYGEDDYVFTAAPGERVYFRMVGHSTGMSYIRWRLVDAAGAEVFSTCLGCTEPGVQILAKGGTCTLTVGSDNDPSTGTYQLRLFNVPAPRQFSIKVGDEIKENAPGPGAGVIESPGVEDIYAFPATAGQRVYFRMWEHSGGMSGIRWRLVDENAMEVFNTCLGCSEPGVQTLLKGGAYTLTVGSSADPSTGSYAFEIGAR